jgi:hypothetical protein
VQAEIGGWTLGASTLTGDNIVLSNTGNITVGTSNNVARLSDDGTIRLWVGHATAASAPFRVTLSGALTATNATITGDITATSGSFSGSITSSSGTIGGFGLTSTTLSAANLTFANTGNITVGTGNDVARLSSSDGTWRLWVGHATAGSAPFRVDKSGFVYVDEGFVDNDWSVAGTLTVGASGTLSLNALAGGGNQYLCVNTSGVVFASSSGC